MLDLLRDLIQHKAFVAASLLKAIRQHEHAAKDEDIRKLLHHIIVSNRFWVKLILGLPFIIEEEIRVPESLEDIAALYQQTYTDELTWISQAREHDLANRLESAYTPGYSFSVAEILMQVIMHSHGHRAQCATRFRELGGTPPALDYIIWLKERPSPDWS